MDKDLFEKAANLRHEIHMYPDLSNQERPTLERVIKFLKENTKNIEIHDKGHYVYCVYRASAPKKPNIAFRADCDALMAPDRIDAPYVSRKPGIGHKCGHDGHTACLAGLIMTVDRYGADRDCFFIFQPAEENGSGAKSCMDFIYDNDIREIYSIHGQGGNYPHDVIASRPGTLQCASKGMIIKMVGKQAHASMPHNGINPTLPLCDVAKYSQDILISGGFKNFVLSTIIYISSGQKDQFGMAAFEGELQLTIRAELQEEMDLLQKMIEEKAAELAIASGLQYSFEYRDEFPETRNNPECVEKVKAAAALNGYEYYEVPEPRRGSEDVGYFLQAVPGAHFYYSFGPEHPAIHTELFDFDDFAIEKVVNMDWTLINM